METATAQDTIVPPPSFVDRKGRRWTIELDFGLAKHVLKTAGVDLVNGDDGKVWLNLRNDIALLVQVLWLVCKEQAERQNVDEETFGRGLAGDALGDAVEALENAWVVFCLPAKRRVMTAVLEQIHRTKEAEANFAVEKLHSPKVTELLTSKFQEASQQVDAEFDRLIASPLTCGGSGSSSPGSSASRRGATP